MLTRREYVAITANAGALLALKPDLAGAQQGGAASTAALHELGAAEAARRIARGELTSEALVSACLARIVERDGQVQAWAYLEPDYALAQARELDRGPRRGPLHGVPFGIKDVFDTADLPTEYNSSIYRGHRPRADAACVMALRQAGAVILGKTVSTEYAYSNPSKTRNPHNPAHTPGGSSSGSAAAVADFMVPAALGTQTAGSVIRPAAYCGAVGCKPSFGLVNRAGLKMQAESLDTIGAFARHPEDLALVLEALSGRAPPDFGAAIERPRVGLCRTPRWGDADAATHANLEAAAQRLAQAGARSSRSTYRKAARRSSSATQRSRASRPRARSPGNMRRTPTSSASSSSRGSTPDGR